MNYSHGTMGCSVKELSGFTYDTVKELRGVKSGDGCITLCVTGSYQEKEEKLLKQAGYKVLAVYKNYFGGHNGNTCKLWVGTTAKNRLKITPKKTKAIKKKA